MEAAVVPEVPEVAAVPEVPAEMVEPERALGLGPH